MAAELIHCRRRGFHFISAAASFSTCACTSLHETNRTRQLLSGCTSCSTRFLCSRAVSMKYRFAWVR